MTGIYKVNDRYMTNGIYQVINLSYDTRCHMTGIFQVYSRYILYVVICGYIPGIYHYYKLSQVSRCVPAYPESRLASRCEREQPSSERLQAATPWQPAADFSEPVLLRAEVPRAGCLQYG